MNSDQPCDCRDSDGNPIGIHCDVHSLENAKTLSSGADYWRGSRQTQLETEREVTRLRMVIGILENKMRVASDMLDPMTDAHVLLSIARDLAKKALNPG